MGDADGDARQACWKSRTTGATELVGIGTTCVTAMPMPSSPSALSAAAEPSTDKAYSGIPRRSVRIALMKAMVGLPASPNSTASGLPAAMVFAAAPASDASFCTAAAATSVTWWRLIAACAAASTSLPKELFW